MIDTHIHVVPPALPGVGTLGLQPAEGIEAVAAWVREEMEVAGVTTCLCMGHYNGGPDDPLGIHSTLDIADRVPGLVPIGIVDPGRTDADHLKRVERQLATRRVKALKAYLGYLHYPPDHAGYRPYYELAERFNLPFIFHTGDTYSPQAKVRFAHPLLVDDVAVDHPSVRFVMAHLGNPWMTEAAEVVYKNVNVYADLSGILVGDVVAFIGERRIEAIEDATACIRKAFRYAERPNRFLYGSDWPLAPMAVYRDFIRSALPPEHHEQVFDENAHRLFQI